MRQAPLRHDRAAARHDAGHPLRGHRDVAQQHAGVDREVVDALLRLLDQRVLEDLPGQVLGLAVDLLERLIDRHGPDRHRRVADDPLARLVDVLAGRQVHHGVAAPADRPRHLVDLFADRRSRRRVADVRVDLHEEVAADDHRLALRVIDVRGNDGAAAGDLVADELGRDARRDGRAERLARMLAHQELRHLRAGRAGILQALDVLLALQVLADRDEFHLGRDDALPRVVHLADVASGDRPLRRAMQIEAQLRQLGVGEPLLPVARRRAGELLGVAALGDPRRSNRGQARTDVDAGVRVGVRPARVVDEDRRVRLDDRRRGPVRGRAAEHRRVGLLDAPHRHPQVGSRAGDVDLRRTRQRRDRRGVDLRRGRRERRRLDGRFRGDVMGGVEDGCVHESSGDGSRERGLHGSLRRMRSSDGATALRPRFEGCFSRCPRRVDDVADPGQRPLRDARTVCVQRRKIKRKPRRRPREEPDADRCRCASAIGHATRRRLSFVPTMHDVGGRVRLRPSFGMRFRAARVSSVADAFRRCRLARRSAPRRQSVPPQDRSDRGAMSR